MVYLKILFFLLSTAILFGCSTTAEFKVNGVNMPRDVQVAIIQSNPYDQGGIVVFWYYAREYGRTINARDISEIIPEKQPLDLTVPKTLSADTISVGINIFVYNPNFFRFRVVMVDPLTFKRISIYEGIRDHYECVLNGPVVSNHEYRISARVDLIGEDGSFIIDSVEIGDLTYSINSSRKH